ncbi:MAG: hypothetical protein OIF35_11940 [Cellvibrionaceae bacterium]|nr:hypothetical protein [Cellvibrionaceae bacterium]MCV6625903.1 hypothetical protein [Cellvibrionaceae bacterium]
MNIFCKAIATTLLASSIVMPLASTQASTVIQQPIETLAKTSDLVFEGKVVGIRSEAVGKKIYTYVSFEVNDIVRGEYQQEIIELRYLGGTANGVTMTVGDMRIPSYGEHGVYFVEQLDGKTVHPLRGWGQGHFIVKQGSGGQRMFNSQGRAITEITPTKQSSAKARALSNSHTAAGVAMDTGAKQVMDLDTFKDSIRELK